MSQNLIIEEVVHAAIRAGHKILEVRDAGFDTEKKGDGSPVTIADQKAEAIIIETLEYLSPDIPIVAEERFAAEGGAGLEGASTFFLVDALDGTKSFVEGGDGYTVNVGLVEDNRVIMGVVYVPVTDVIYVGDVVAGKAFKIINASTPNRLSSHIQVRKRPDEGAVIVSSIHHIDSETKDFLAKFPTAIIEPTSSSIKFCCIAEGIADIYPRFGSIMEWDTAAGHAVLNAAGGHVLAPDGSPFMYGKKGFRNTSFIALGDAEDTSFWA